LANGEGYGRSLQRDGGPGSQARRYAPAYRRQFGLRRSKSLEVHPPLRELPLEVGKTKSRPKAPPWRARAKTDGQWSRDGEIR
jgi:hypothetical protein